MISITEVGTEIDQTMGNLKIYLNFYPVEGSKKEKIDVIEPQHDFRRWKASLGPVFQKACKNITDISFRMPKLGKEDKTFCSLSPQTQLEEKCDIMSVGSNRQWGFELSLLKLYPYCTIHTFDCTTKDNNFSARRIRNVWRTIQQDG